MIKTYIQRAIDDLEVIKLVLTYNISLETDITESGFNLIGFKDILDTTVSKLKLLRVLIKE